VSLLEYPRRHLELEANPVCAARLDGFGLFAGCSVREVQQAAGDERRVAVGKHVAELRGEVCDGSGRGDAHLEHGVPEDLQLFVERFPLV
jgi:hypothetical protein